MKIVELQQIEMELIEGLRQRAKGGDNQASEVLLAHLREVSKNIDLWRQSMPKRKDKPAQ